ncbi:MAG TPA: hypothetical protein VF401_02515 [Candidatus Saccharimonadales bacterium]
MIKLTRSGLYKLIETKRNTKILYLDDDVFAWVEPRALGEILVLSRKPHQTDCLLGIGNYFVYSVSDEKGLSSHVHLELEVGNDIWQGYLLLTGLPNEHKKRARIIPTHEVITDNPAFSDRQFAYGDALAV